MRTVRIAKVTLAALALGLAGCRTIQQETETHCSSFWMYIPTPSIDKARGAPAEVPLPSWFYTTNRIEVFVSGEVRSPGRIMPPEGCTVLQAIGYAGGFTDFAFTPRLSLLKGSGQRLDLHLRSRPKDRFGHRQAWYEFDSASGRDYVLQAGDRLHVGRSVQ
jgi:hypothetical protein